MFLKINVKGEGADFSSFIFGKNPNRHFVGNERAILNDCSFENNEKGDFDFNKIDISTLSKDLVKMLKKDRVINEENIVINENKGVKYFVKDNELIRKKTSGDLENHFVYKKYSETEVEAVLFTLTNSLSFSKDFNGYVNEKEYLTTSVFQGVIGEVLRSALNNDGEDYKKEFNLTYEIGPFKIKTSRETLNQLFSELGYDLELEMVNEPISFKVKRDEIAFLKLSKKGTIYETLRQIYVLISSIDNFKHFKPSEADMLKLKKYAEGWLENHSLRKMITDRYLSYTTYSRDLISEMDSKQEKVKKKTEANSEIEEKGYGENGVSLNTVRLQKMKDAILNCKAKKVLDLGCGEGNLLKLLGNEDLEVVGLDSSERAITKAYINLKKAGLKDKVKIIQGSLYYKDSRLNDFDTVVLCEVIEHIEIDRVPMVINNILDIKPKNFILSTPNKDFNKFFKDLKGELRYYDHRFEFTYEEFEKFAKGISEFYGYKYKIESFGKEIEGIRPTMMVTFIKEEN